MSPRQPLTKGSSLDLIQRALFSPRWYELCIKSRLDPFAFATVSRVRRVVFVGLAFVVAFLVTNAADADEEILVPTEQCRDYFMVPVALEGKGVVTR